MERRPIHRYGAVLFDCDDTIIETSKTRWDVMRKTAKVISGYDLDADELTDDKIRAAWGQPFDKMVRQLLPRVDYDEFVAMYREAMRQHAPTAAPGAEALLSFLRESGVEMRMVSSGSRDLIDQDLDALGLQQYFTRIYGCEQTRRHKPHRRSLSRPINDLSSRRRRPRVRRSEIVYIGDAVRDYQASSKNRVAFIGVTSGLESRDDLLGAGVPGEMIVDSLDELIPADAEVDLEVAAEELPR
jgi:phosphoglycolate phosphatase-like HAD superfamily hydrolase